MPDTIAFDVETTIVQLYKYISPDIYQIRAVEIKSCGKKNKSKFSSEYLGPIEMR